MTTQIYYPEEAMINGVNWHAAWAFQKDAGVRKAILDDMAGAGLTSVRLDYAWATLEPSKGSYSFSQLDTFVNEAAAHNMTVLVMLYWPPAWASSTGASAKSAPPKVNADFGNICGQVGKRYGSKLAGVEMWNEPDLTTFWSGTRTQFFQLISTAYPVAKNLAPNTTFVAAAPTYIGLASNWFKDAYASGIYKGKYDAQAIHPYMSPSDLPPDAPKTNWSIKGIADLQALRSTNGDTSPLWATEWGWSTHSHPSGTANYFRGVSEDQQATYTVDAIKLMAPMGVSHSYVYTDVDMSQTSTSTPGGLHEHYFGLQRENYTDKPVLGALKTYLKAQTPVQPPVVQPPVVEPPVTAPPIDPVLEARFSDLEHQIATLTAAHVDLERNVQGLAASVTTLANSAQAADAALSTRLSNLGRALQAAAMTLL